MFKAILRNSGGPLNESTSEDLADVKAEIVEWIELLEPGDTITLDEI